MRAVLQRVSQAEVRTEERTISRIQQGLVLLLGIAKGDTAQDADYIVDKTIHLRVFQEEDSSFQHSVVTVQGELLIVSQFTLLANLQKGRRPDFFMAEVPDLAKQWYEYVVRKFRTHPLSVHTGTFGASMQVHLVNEGPVTLLLDSQVKSDMKAL